MNKTSPCPEETGLGDSRQNQFSAKSDCTVRVRLRERESIWVVGLTPPTSPVRLERSGRNQSFKSVMPVLAGVIVGRIQPVRGGAGKFTQAADDLFLSFWIESRINRSLRAGPQKQGAAHRFP